MSGGSTESEVLAQEPDSLGNKVRDLETRLAEVEKIISWARSSRADHRPAFGAVNPAFVINSLP
jgi:hypothetical protein